MSEDGVYQDRDIVWAKVETHWWPCEVISENRYPEGLLQNLSRRPYCVVKFFQEEQYEFVKNSNQIFPFICYKREEFTKKGIDLHNANYKYMEKFPRDVKIAERLIEPEPVDIVINDKRSLVKVMLGQSKTRVRNELYDDGPSTSTGKSRRSVNSVTKILNITPNVTKSSGTTTTTTTSAPVAAAAASSSINTSSTASTPSSGTYSCSFCSFKSTRLQTMVLHRRNHGPPRPRPPPFKSVVRNPRHLRQPVNSCCNNRLHKLTRHFRPVTKNGKLASYIVPYMMPDHNVHWKYLTTTEPPSYPRDRSPMPTSASKTTATATTTATTSATATTTTQNLPSSAPRTAQPTNKFVAPLPFAEPLPPALQKLYTAAMLPKKKELASMAMKKCSQQAQSSSSHLATDMPDITLPTPMLEPTATNDSTAAAAVVVPEEIPVVVNVAPIAAVIPSDSTSTSRSRLEELRQSYIDDWSEDEENEDGKQTAEKANKIVENAENAEEIVPPTTIESAQTNSEEVEISSVNVAASTSTTTPTTSNRIRNIPKKDRRDVVLKEFNNESALCNSTSSTSTSTTTPASVVNVDSSGSNSDTSDSVIIVDLTSDEPIDVDKLEEVVTPVLSDDDREIEVPRTLAPHTSTPATINIYDISEEKDDDEIEDNVVPTATDTDASTSNAIPQLTTLSCFDFEEDEDNDIDVLRSIANFKKKYLSPDKTKDVIAEGENDQKSDESRKSTDATTAITQKKDQQLLADIESLLEQTTSTVVSTSIVASVTNTSTSSGSRDDVCVKGLPIKERGKRIFKSRNRLRVDEQSAATASSSILNTETCTEYSITNDDNTELTKECDAAEVMEVEQLVDAENDVEPRDDVSTEITDIVQAKVVEIARNENLCDVEVMDVNQEATPVESNTIPTCNENQPEESFINGTVSEEPEARVELPSSQNSMPIQQKKDEIKRDDVVTTLKYNSLDLKNSEFVDAVAVVCVDEIVKESNENGTFQISGKVSPSVQLEDSCNGIKENSDQHAAGVNVEQYSADLLNRFTSPTDENSSIGVSEAGAEFGSPTSMLDDERLPLTANLPMTPTECLTREITQTALIPDILEKMSENIDEGETKINKHEVERVDEADEIVDAAELDVHKINTELEVNEKALDAKPNETSSDECQDAKQSHSVKPDLIVLNVDKKSDTLEEEDDEIESPPHEALSGNELEAEIEKLRKLKAAITKPLKRKTIRTPTLSNPDVKPTENEFGPQDGAEEKQESEKLSKTLQTKLSEVVETNSTEPTKNEVVIIESLQQNESVLQSVEDESIEPSIASSNEDSTKYSSKKAKEPSSRSNRKTKSPTAEAKETVAPVLVHQLEIEKITEDSKNIEDKECTIKKENQPEDTTNADVATLSTPDANSSTKSNLSVTPPNVLDNSDTTPESAVTDDSSEKPTTARKRRSCMKITPRRRPSEIAASKDTSPTTLKTKKQESSSSSEDNIRAKTKTPELKIKSQTKSTTVETATDLNQDTTASTVIENPKTLTPEPKSKEVDQAIELNEPLEASTPKKQAITPEAVKVKTPNDDTKTMEAVEVIPLNEETKTTEAVEDITLNEDTKTTEAATSNLLKTDEEAAKAVDQMLESNEPTTLEVEPPKEDTPTTELLSEQLNTAEQNENPPNSSVDSNSIAAPAPTGAGTTPPKDSLTKSAKTKDNVDAENPTTITMESSSAVIGVSEIRSFRPSRSVASTGSDNNESNVSAPPETDSNIDDIVDNSEIIAELDATLNTKSLTPPATDAVPPPNPRTPSPSVLEKVRINVDVANPLSTQIAGILLATTSSSTVQKQLSPSALVTTNKKRMQNKSSATGSTMKRKKSIEDDIPSFIIERPTPQQQHQQQSSETAAGAAEKDAVVAHMQNKCPQVKITRKEKPYEPKKEAGEKKSPDFTKINTKTATTNEEATMFDISNMPILLGNDEQLLPDNIHIVITPTSSSAADIDAATAVTMAQLPDKTRILQQQILQPAHATQQQQRERKLSASARTKRRSTPPHDLLQQQHVETSEAAEAQKIQKLDQRQQLQKNSQAAGTNKQIGVDSRGNKYVIIKTSPPADLVVQQLPLLQQHNVVATQTAKAQTATFSIGARRSTIHFSEELSASTISPPTQQSSQQPTKPISPAAAATGGRKQAGNTITLPSSITVKQHQQKFSDDLDAATTTSSSCSSVVGLPTTIIGNVPAATAMRRKSAIPTTPSPRKQTSPTEQHNESFSSGSSGGSIGSGNNRRRRLTDSSSPAKIPKLTATTTIVVPTGDNVSMAQQQLLQLQQQQQRRKSQQQQTPPPLHHLHNRKPRKQPQQHRSSTTTTTVLAPATAAMKTTTTPDVCGQQQQQQQLSALQTQQQAFLSQTSTMTQTQTQQQAVHSTTFSEEQLMQIQSEDQNEGPSKILAVPTQPIPGYNETFLLCTLVDNTYKPIDNAPLYLDNDLNQLKPVPLEALDGQPNLIVNHPPPEETINQQQQQQQMHQQQSTRQQQHTLTAAGALNSVEADSSTTQQQHQQQQLICLQPMMTEGAGTAAEVAAALEQQQQLSSNAVVVAGADATTAAQMGAAVYMPPTAAGDVVGTSEIVAENAVILNIEGQQIILDAATFAHLLANPDANTQLITDDGTEFVLTHEVLAALQAQQEAQNAEEQQQQQHQQQLQLQQQQQQQQQQQHHHLPPTDILAVALADSVYGSEVLEIETSQVPGLQLMGDVVFQQPPPHLTPPITALTSETNALLNQTPIMSPLEKPSTAAALMGKRKSHELTGGGGGGRHHHQLHQHQHHLLGSAAAADHHPSSSSSSSSSSMCSSARPNLDDSLAVIGVTAQSSTVPTSLELPITVTNPAIAPKVTMATQQLHQPLSDIAAQFTHPHQQRPVSHPIATASAVAVAVANSESTRGGGIYSDPAS